MKIKISALRKIIKEEIQLALEESTSYSKSSPEWQALKKYLGMKEYQRLYSGPSKPATTDMHWVSWVANEGYSRQEIDEVFKAWNDYESLYNELVTTFKDFGPDSDEYELARAALEKGLSTFMSVWKPMEKVFINAHRAEVNKPRSYTPANKDAPVTRTAKMSPEERRNWELAGSPESPEALAAWLKPPNAY